MTKLSARKVDALKLPGRYGDGGGLYLHVAPGGSKSWVLRATVKGRMTPEGNPYRVEIGLGSVELVSLAEAREAALPLRKLARDGVNPLDEKRRETLTFKDAAERVHKQLLPTWRNKKHAETWLATVETYAFPTLGGRFLESIGTADILALLSPIWTEKHETAKRLKQRLSSIFDWAKGAGHYPHENPVNGLKKALPVVKRRAEHLPALPWQEVSAFMGDLRQRDGVSARTLEFIILTAARSGEARGARWAEFDLANKVWTVPGERMKRGLPHRVPLSPEALAVVERMQGLDADLVFPGPKRDRKGKAQPQSVMVFKALLKRMKQDDITVHGFRSTFRDWCSESAHAEREVAEAALSHATGNEVERAYARSDLFKRRRTLMETWGRYATGKAGDVVQMVRA
ncbi:MAG: integrase arm-type DNA-binding domain-containing protein [Rhizobiaceae bacterium]|nr:integrase arm-type DNA-binding domain-containing protein [Rhizobiaceae bacterium]